MRARRAGLGVAVLLAAWLVSPVPAARAQGNIEVGPLRISPFFELSGRYDDNILLAPRDELEDFIWTISPGLSVELPGRRYALRLGYRADVLRYTDFGDELDTVHHTVKGEAKLETARGLTLYAKDEFKRTSDFAGFPVPELTSRAERNENWLQTGFEYSVRERWALGFEYRYFFVDYREDASFDQFDRDDHTFAVSLFYRIRPKTSVFGEYDYQFIRYDLEPVALDRDSDGHRFWLGVKGDVTAKTAVIVKGGWEFKDYDNPAREDWDGLIMEGEVIWKYRDPSQVRVYAGRANVESTFENNNFYVATYGGVELRHYLRPRLVMLVQGLVGVNDYDEPATVSGVTGKRSDDFVEAAVGVRYQIQRWLGVELRYDYLMRDSNFPDFDYTDNRVTGIVRLTY